MNDEHELSDEYEPDWCDAFFDQLALCGASWLASFMRESRRSVDKAIDELIGPLGAPDYWQERYVNYRAELLRGSGHLPDDDSVCSQNELHRPLDDEAVGGRSHLEDWTALADR